ncbi:MAG: roadblock/LC7 domain-containing protein [Promethearchaeota archaeon]
MLDDGIIRKIEKIIKDLRSNQKIQGWFVLTKEGLHIDSNLFKDANEHFIAAISATLINISKGAVKEYGCGKIKRLVIQGAEGNIILSKIKPGYIMGVLEGPEGS